MDSEVVGIVFVSLLGAAAWLTLCYHIAKKFDDIAKMKGHKENYFWWCFFLGIVGWLMVVALPDRSAPTQTAAAPETPAAVADELPDL